MGLQIEEVPALGATPAAGDLIPIVDVDDTTDDAGGTTKYVTYANFTTGLGGGGGGDWIDDTTPESGGDVTFHHHATFDDAKGIRGGTTLDDLSFIDVYDTNAAGYARAMEWVAGDPPTLALSPDADVDIYFGSRDSTSGYWDAANGNFTVDTNANSPSMYALRARNTNAGTAAAGLVQVDSSDTIGKLLAFPTNTATSYGEGSVVLQSSDALWLDATAKDIVFSTDGAQTRAATITATNGDFSIGSNGDNTDPFWFDVSAAGSLFLNARYLDLDSGYSIRWDTTNSNRIWYSGAEMRFYAAGKILEWNNGQLGIGTLSPNAMLDIVIAGNTDVGLNIELASTPTAAAIQVTSDGGTAGDLLEVDAQGDFAQSNAAGARPVVRLNQADIDDSFIDFIGTSAADGTRSISSDTTEDSTKFGAIRVEINGVTKWIRIYDDES